jgi:hypothetical protein
MPEEQIENYLRRGNRPKVQRDVSLSAEKVSATVTNNQEAVQAVELPEEEKVASTIRLRKSINKLLNNLKSDRGITKDAFIEAAWEVCEQQPEIMELIIQKSKAITAQRRNQGVLNRSQSAIKRINSIG